jgi:hyperosmotically inducible protein
MKTMLGVGVLWAAVAGAVGLTGGNVARADEPTSREQMKTEKQIRANLQNDRDLGNNRIDVRVSDGVATLKGTVDSATERDTAVRLASVSGVRVVDDQLTIAGAGTKAAIDDTSITTKIKSQYLANTDLRHANVAVATDSGVVTLTGTVPSEDLRRLAVDLARHTGGVTQVDDQLRVIGSAPADP